MTTAFRKEANPMVTETARLLKERATHAASIAPITSEEKQERLQKVRAATKAMMDNYYDSIGLGSSSTLATLFNDMAARPKKIALHISGGDAKEPPKINDMSQDDLARMIEGASIAIAELERLKLLAKRFHALRGGNFA